LGKIKPWDALFYMLAQFAGAILAAQVMARALGKLYSHPSIHYVTTIPGAGAGATARAFTAEFIISFILVFVVLVAINSTHLERFAGLFAGLLIGTFNRRSALFGHEPESGAQFRLGSRGAALARFVDIFHGSAARNTARRRSLQVVEKGSTNSLRPAASAQRSTLHFLRP
jgi:hypothetical protein